MAAPANDAAAEAREQPSNVSSDTGPIGPVAASSASTSQTESDYVKREPGERADEEAHCDSCCCCSASERVGNGWEAPARRAAAHGCTVSRRGSSGAEDGARPRAQPNPFKRQSANRKTPTAASTSSRSHLRGDEPVRSDRARPPEGPRLALASPVLVGLRRSHHQKRQVAATAASSEASFAEPQQRVEGRHCATARRRHPRLSRISTPEPAASSSTAR